MKNCMSFLLLFDFLFLFFPKFLEAQNKPDFSIFLKEINRDIWQPFSEAYAGFNAEKYIALHSKDFIRTQGDSKWVANLTEYGKRTTEGFQKGKEMGNQVRISFRFLERFANQEFASERGIYEYMATDKEGIIRKFYGKFHVILRKENGQWKILSDYDSSEKNSINEQSFKEAAGIEEFEKYK